jgi:membrane associated rhomboid family serine protease
MSITLLIVIVTGITSFMAFSNPRMVDELIFWPYRMWRHNEWHRLITSSFIHADISHLLFNMLALYSFGQNVEYWFAIVFGTKSHVLYFFLYFGAVAVADIYNLFAHRDDYGYRSLGASGGVSAIVFAQILYDPFGHMGKIYFFFIPIGIPPIVFGILYLIYCIYMARRGTDHIGHIAHFTGSIYGFIFPILFNPALFTAFIYQLTGRL